MKPVFIQIKILSIFASRQSHLVNQDHNWPSRAVLLISTSAKPANDSEQDFLKSNARFPALETLSVEICAFSSVKDKRSQT